MASADKNAVKKITGFASKEELLANKSESELISVIEKIFVEIDLRNQYGIDPKDEDGLGYVMGFKTIQEFIDSDPRATDEDILKIEEALGVSLPSEFVRFHKEFGKGHRGFTGDWFEYSFDENYYGLENLYSATWDSDGKCQLVEHQEDYWKGNFVSIGDFDSDELYGLEAGHLGFFVKDGVCQDEIIFIDHEYSGENLSAYWQKVDSIFGFILRAVRYS